MCRLAHSDSKSAGGLGGGAREAAQRIVRAINVYVRDGQAVMGRPCRWQRFVYAGSADTQNLEIAGSRVHIR